eukprot:16434889-Heterocapsa_arctica.AAC.2
MDQDVKQQKADQHKAHEQCEHYDTQEERGDASPPEQPQRPGHVELLCERKIVPRRGRVFQNG